MGFTIAVLPGDGIGPEVVAEGVKVLHAVARRFALDLTLEEGLIGGIAIDQTGEPLPPATVALCQSADAVLLGAVGGPKWDDPTAKVRPEQGLLAIRKTLGLFANLRPVTIHPLLVDASPLRPERLEGVDLLVVRELTGGIYFGEKRRERDAAGEWASDLCLYTEAEIVRVVRVAASLARTRHGKLTLVDKANVLETSRLWRSVTTRLMQEEFSDLSYDWMLVDACAMHLLRKPSDFDVIVTENMFGDILTDETSMLAGSMGMLPSASLGEGHKGLYEPIHGSAPDIAGQGKANPFATILSCAMLLRHSLQHEAAARAVEAAVSATLEAGCITGDLARGDQAVATTAAVGDAVVMRI
ncbi:MAG: 3-isopropylmalate dehydrogenase [Candidatus Viridilinea halotolerans]|uniref:3-isopropylmalate dehydrogenase n=1 Tax=Candidatus Viridilinea halotolerans TaxID=2491704 RepID=A0A426TY64_9CHLR|nr:MAG: 3-isopropylmalate dehydrogenase [Candidatus Viridilinea halotolerans]